MYIQVWEAAWPVRLLRRGPTWLVQALVSLISLLCFNRFVLWCVSAIAQSPGLHTAVRRTCSLPCGGDDALCCGVRVHG